MIPAEDLAEAVRIAKGSHSSYFGWAMTPAGVLFSVLGIAVAADDSSFGWTHLAASLAYRLGVSGFEIQSGSAHAAYRALGMTDDGMGGYWAGSICSWSGVVTAVAAGVVHFAAGGYMALPLVISSVSLVLSGAVILEADRARYQHKTFNISDNTAVTAQRPSRSRVRIVPVPHVSVDSGTVGFGVVGVM